MLGAPTPRSPLHIAIRWSVCPSACLSFQR